ncbi:MAG: SPFH domain-containing protein [Planctomycetota bacterium]
MAEYQLRRTGETQRLFAPLVAAIDAVVSRLGWILGALVVLYLASGVTFVKEGEVALVMRFGRVVGATPQEQLHEPGLLLALPFPLDRVVRVPRETVREVRVDALDASDEARANDPLGAEQGDTIDPDVEGYVVTGDRFVMQTRLTARYRVKDPLEYALGGDESEREKLVRDVVQAATVRAVTSRISYELWEQLGDLPVEIRLQAQDELDRLASGVELIEVVPTGFDYPRQVLRSVRDVTDAKQERARSVYVARGDAQQRIARVASRSSELLSWSRQYASNLVSRFDGQLAAYRQIEEQYRAAPLLVRTRMLYARLAKIQQEASPNVTLALPPGPDGQYGGDTRFTTTPRRRSSSDADTPAGEGD